MNINSNMPTNTARDEINESTSATRTPIGLLAQQWLAKYLPPKIPLGLAIKSQLQHWEPQTNYVIRSTYTTDTDAIILTLAQQFASSGGHVIWVGVTDDLCRISEQLMFKIAGLELAVAGTSVQLDAIAQCKLMYAHEQIGKLWIDFCNLDDCGDEEVEQEFLASVSSFKPTLIVVDESIFDDAALTPFEALVRQTHALRMVEELRDTNPMGSVLWHLLIASVDGSTEQLPLLAKSYPTVYLTISGTSVAEPDLDLST
ncbi:hypothetical protein HH213_14915 [Duganella dendranthematis]|uniref:Uncharacterized protein n=1 Tax=Duganella dendranthematis TaxID=2728021 RepID=A0ABX6MB57_9BURK|nr:hypothetical protein [Duganella dendranthematis]QJD91249.1 hypothetical protein HH213_14915 [Duganella dendranthematis]